LASVVYLDLDRAWLEPPIGLPRIDALEWGPKLRFSAPGSLIERFVSEISPRLAPTIVYGSGDFHHLSALWARRCAAAEIVVTFDNHPDWDIRPPRWCCGSWINRVLELPHIAKASVWGCGNFECWWPGQLWGNRRAERAGRLEVHPWADDRVDRDKARPGAILRETWRAKFERFVDSICARPIYISVDMDCFAKKEAITNWESGRFNVEEVSWAIGKLREACVIVGADICGAYSEPHYARRKQRFAAEMDHPLIEVGNVAEARATNAATVAALLPVLAG